MKSDTLYNALNGLDDDLLEETARARRAKVTHTPVWLRIAAVAACACAVVGVAAFSLQNMSPSISAQAADLTENITPHAVALSDNVEEGSAALTNFAVRLLQATDADQNTLLSPLSVADALTMTANGANGTTRVQMEQMFGLSIEELTAALYSYQATLPQSEDYSLCPANSIWFADSEHLAVRPDFLQRNADYFGAAAYKIPFNDAAPQVINQWVNQKTQGRIPTIVDTLSADSVMYLINALTFDAVWDEPYQPFQVENGIFHAADGTEQTVPMMHSGEWFYLTDTNAMGVVKHYKDCKYAFAALLPNEGVSLSDYVASLTGDRLHNVLQTMHSGLVKATIPKFSVTYDCELSEPLMALGMTDAFDVHKADFSGIGTSDLGNLFIGSVLHKTFLQLDENGTKAAAVTSVETKCGAAPGEPVTVCLDRPFVYLLIDCETCTPFFIGTVRSL